MRRTEPHIYVANWFYLAFIVTIAVLHLGNNAAVPVSVFSSKSYIVWSGVQDAMVQWWYGHNAVGFFLTAGFLGIMYYFIPKRADRPVYSYRLSIIHFWSLIFLYIWAGPHHLHYTALPDWAQTLGMTFSIMLWMPSWGGMINGIMTLSGAWDKLRTDPVLRMMVVSVAFYGMATFEGPMMSVKIVNSLSHYTDWTIGHVHSGALGWVGYISFGATVLSGAVALEPAALLTQTGQLALLDLDDRHRAVRQRDVGVGNPARLDVARLHESRLPRILIRRDGGSDASLLRHSRDRRSVVSHRRAADGVESLEDRDLGSVHRAGQSPVGAGRVAGVHMSFWSKHAIFEKNSIVLVIGILIVIAIGGLVEIVPLFYLKNTIEKVDGVRPYTPARACGPQYLCARRLLRLSLADDPAVARRGRAVRSLLARSREHVRQAVPVGQQAYRPGSCPHRRQIFRRLAS